MDPTPTPTPTLDHSAHEAAEAAEAGALFDRLMEGPLRLAGAAGPEAPARVGPWVLGDRIGAGGMSTVYAATRPTPAGPERAALKLAKRPGDGTRALFAREASLLDRLHLPALVRVIDQGTHTDDRPYLALERVEGRPVGVDARGRSGWERLLLLWRVCRAVDGLHRAGVVHGDLKPDHLLVRADGTVVVLDLGLARDLHEPSPSPGHGPGLTPEFAAPEQILGGPVGCPADVYALGLVIREVLEGRRGHLPWACGGDDVATLDLPPEMSDPSGSTVAQYVVGVLRTALQTDPARRFPSAGALAGALDGVLDAVSEALRPA